MLSYDYRLATPAIGGLLLLVLQAALMSILGMAVRRCRCADETCAHRITRWLQAVNCHGAVPERGSLSLHPPRALELHRRLAPPMEVFVSLCDRSSLLSRLATQHNGG